MAGTLHRQQGTQFLINKNKIMEKMSGKVALITGAGQGIGLATAEAFAEAGAIVILADIKEPKEQAQKLISEGYKAASIHCDVADDQEVKKMIEWIVTIE